MKINYNYLYFIVLSFLSAVVHAQTTNFKLENYTSDEGLSNNNINRIIEDPTGFIWVGTPKGLNRFDGFSFKTYLTDSNDPNSLISPHIETLLIDRKGNLWVGTISGLDKFDKAHEKFIHISNVVKCSILKNLAIKALTEDNNGNIWIGTHGQGLFKLDPTTFTITSYANNKNIPKRISSNYINALFYDASGKLWIGTESGLSSLDIRIGAIKQYNNIKNTNLTEGLAILSIAPDKGKEGNLLICTWSNGLCIYNRKSDCIEKIALPQKNNQLISNTAVISALVDKDGLYWITTFFNGLVVFDPRKNTISSFWTENKDPFFMKFYTTWALLEDRYGIKWVGTFGSGMVKIVKNNIDFQNPQNVVYKSGVKFPSNPNIKSICKTKDHKILVGTDGGEINIYNPEKNVFDYYLDRKTLSSQSIIAIFEDKYSKLWIGTEKGIETYYPANGKHELIIPSRLVTNKTGVPNQASILSISIDSSGWVWMGSFDAGIFKYNPKTGVCKQYLNIKNDPRSLSNNIVWSIYVDHKNNVWIGTRSFLNRYDRKNDNFVRYEYDPSNPHSISHTVISHIYEDSKSNLWIATLGNGINKYDPDKEAFTCINEANGLSDNSILGIAEDKKGNLWLSSAKGLSKYNPVNGAIQNFNKSNGLRDNLFNMKVCSNSPEGILYFGGNNGLNVINPDSIKDVTDVPQIVLTDLKRYNKSVYPGKYIDGRLILPKDINESEEIYLNYNDYVVSLEFSVLDYAYPKINRYAYMLEGFDNEWVFTDATRRFAYYTNLAPGRYTFKVKATNHCGVWSNDYKSLVINITPPFWATAWFRILVIFVFILSVYLFIRFRIKYYKDQKNILEEQVIKKTDEIAKQCKILEHKNEELSNQKEEILEMANKIKEADEKKTRFFTSISHELRTPLTLILGPAENLMKNNLLQPSVREQATPIFKNANRLLRLINELLDFQKIDNNTMKLHQVESNIVKFISDIVYSFDTQATKQHIDLYFIPEVQEYKTFFDPDKIEIILYNLLANAFKFTSEGGKIKVSLLIQEENHSYQIIVGDNGVGIDEINIKDIFNRYYQIESGGYSHHGTGIGLALTKEIIELMKGKIIVDSSPNRGTVFTITLPLLNQESAGGNNKYIVIKENELRHDEQLIPQFIDDTDLSEPSDLEKQEPNSDKILIIDDNADLRNYIKGCLSDKYMVFEAANGREGLILAQSKLPQLIISDIMMPEIDGIELCIQLKSDITTSHIPVIFLTAKASSETQIESYRTGADEYLTKPFQKDVLVARIRNLIDSREKLRKKFISKTDFNPKEITLTTTDERFLKNAFEIVEKHLSDSEFGPSELVAEIGMSRTMVFYKLKELTNSNASEFIKNIRLKRAYQMLKHDQYRVSEVGYQVGFADPNYFSKSFKKLYGVSPTKFAEHPF